MINYMMFQCSLCGLKLADEKRLKIHFKTHEKKEAKNKKQKRSVMADFEKPDFSQVMWNPSQKIISNFVEPLPLKLNRTMALKINDKPSSVQW